MQTVWYFEKPTIGYCPDCDLTVDWNNVKGLHCPQCRTRNVSIFEWDGESRHPESDEKGVDCGGD